MNPNDPWTERSRTLLDGSLDQIDAESRARLAAARRRALAAAQAQPRWHGGWLALAAAAGVAGVALIATPRLLGPPQQEIAELPVPQVEAAPLAVAELDLLIDAGNEDAMIAELEFYAWLSGEFDDES